MSRRRQTIAHRLVEAQQTAAMLTTFNEIDMSKVMELRAARKDAFKERHGVNLGFMSFFTKAAVGALKAFPYVNAEIQGDEIVLKHYYDIGIAVGIEEGLVVPVVRDADRKTFADIEREILDLATRAREGNLALHELMGGTFTITNGGYARDPETTGRRRRRNRDPADDVRRPLLRPPSCRRQHRGAVSGADQAAGRGSHNPAARRVIARPAIQPCNGNARCVFARDRTAAFRAPGLNQRS
jgi:pyruvate/2-oxoglutarate dehydrogenase complex dihydrolipoamide acyltransferase (E2) component